MFNRRENKTLDCLIFSLDRNLHQTHNIKRTSMTIKKITKIVFFSRTRLFRYFIELIKTKNYGKILGHEKSSELVYLKNNIFGNYR